MNQQTKQPNDESFDLFPDFDMAKIREELKEKMKKNKSTGADEDPPPDD